MRKTLITILATVLVCACVVGGSYAWLVAKTATVTNVFTVGDINIELAESASLDLKMMPGKTITKDPTVTVKTGSEACWLFVKIDETNVADYFTYSVADGWTALPEKAGVYYREVAAVTGADVDFAVLLDNKVTVNQDVTKEELEAVATNSVELAFTAYAVQKEGITTAADAWAKVN